MHHFILLFCVAEKIERTVQIEASTVEIEERGVKLRLTVVDTPGYGDAINSQDWWGLKRAEQFTFRLAFKSATDGSLCLNEMNTPLPVSTPSSATSTTSLSATSTTRAVSIAGTSLTTEFTAASTSSRRSAMGESRHTRTFLSVPAAFIHHTSLFSQLLKSDVCLWPDASASPVQPAWSRWTFSSWRPSTTRSTWFPSSPRRTLWPSKRGRGSNAGWGQHSAIV